MHYHHLVLNYTNQKLIEILQPIQSSQYSVKDSKYNTFVLTISILLKTVFMFQQLCNLFKKPANEKIEINLSHTRINYFFFVLEIRISFAV